MRAGYDRPGRIAVVVIGRNEGVKLERSLRSALATAWPVVYVDSCSSDGSVDLARRLGASVVELATPPPCSIARARNAGFAHASALDPELMLVQFLDGDSELSPGWCAAAGAAMASNPVLGAVFGTMRERDPRRSLLSRIYHVEFGQHRMAANDCPGMSLMRAAAFRAAGGFPEDLIHFEDRELSNRLREAGWQIQRLDAEMAVHEVGGQSFAAWWGRRWRGGYDQACELSRHRPRPAAALRGSLRAWFWGLLLPLTAVAAGTVSRPALLLLPLGYALLFARIARRVSRWGFSSRDAAAYAAAAVVAKVPEALGQLHYYGWRAVRR